MQAVVWSPSLKLAVRESVTNGSSRSLVSLNDREKSILTQSLESAKKNLVSRIDWV